MGLLLHLNFSVVYYVLRVRFLLVQLGICCRFRDAPGVHAHGGDGIHRTASRHTAPPRDASHRHSPQLNARSAPGESWGRGFSSRRSAPHRNSSPCSAPQLNVIPLRPKGWRGTLLPDGPGVLRRNSVHRGAAHRAAARRFAAQRHSAQRNVFFRKESHEDRNR